MAIKFHVKKDDKVRVISGENKGQEGRVLVVDREKYRALVEGVNLVSRHQKPSAANPDGGIVKKEAGIHLSNLAVIDAEGNATRVGRKLNKDDKLVRYSKKSGEEIK